MLQYDAEIGFWENKGREQERQVELLQQQISSADNQLRISTEQVISIFLLDCVPTIDCLFRTSQSHGLFIFLAAFAPYFLFVFTWCKFKQGIKQLLLRRIKKKKKKKI